MSADAFPAHAIVGNARPLRIGPARTTDDIMTFPIAREAPLKEMNG